MAIVDIENSINEEKEHLEIAIEMLNSISSLEFNTPIYLSIIKQLNDEISSRNKEIEKLEYSIINERKNCGVCIWSNAISNDVIICTSFASIHNGHYVQKNYANKCKQFHKTEGFFERR